MTIICLAHAEIKRFDAPDTEAYDRYQIKLHKRARRWCRSGPTSSASRITRS
jgi:hypothetical protein